MGKRIETLLKEGETYYPSPSFKDQANSKDEKIFSKKAVDFWDQSAKDVEWFKPYKKVLDDSRAPFFKWYVGGKINITYNCLDRHVQSWRKNKVALMWEAEDGATRTFSYYQLYLEVNRFANALKRSGVKKGDRVVIYLGMIPEIVISMLACARIGAVHVVVFAGFSSNALKERIETCKAKVVITSDGSLRRGKTVPLKESVDKAIEDLDYINRVVVVKRMGSEITLKDNRDVWWDDLVNDCESTLESAVLDSEDPLFVLFTSGTTGKPKGVVHLHGDYNVGTTITAKMVLDLKDSDIYWCTADIGWITGHSYIVYGPLSLGATTVLYEGAPDYPAPDRFWKMIEKYGVTVFYTAPTAIRFLKRLGDEHVKKHCLDSLRLLGSVGEPINPEAWKWFYKTIGGKRCPIVDTWWQTESGIILISTLPGFMAMKPGAAGKSLPGIDADVFNDKGESVGINEGGHLVIKGPWPGMMQTLYGDPKKYKEIYWSKFKGVYLTGDGARKDKDGYIWILGRIDDVLSVSGHRIGTMEVESALVAHPDISEAAVVGKPHEIKGQAIAAFVVLKKGVEIKEGLWEGLRKFVSEQIGPIAKPDEIHFVEKLPKTRSGKIMRRIIRAVAEGKREFGDISTLEDESALDAILKA